MQRRLLVPATVFLAIIVIAIGGITLYNRSIRQNLYGEIEEQASLKQNLLATRDDDHIYGERNALIKIIEYSDTDCQYCRALYPRLKRIVDYYPPGTVAMIYRHIPIYEFRGSIDKEEIMSECVARERGNEGFFNFIGALFARLPKGERTQNVAESIILESALEAGVSEKVARECLEEKYGTALIASQHESGDVLGITTVPHTFIVSSQEIYEVVGAKPESVFRAIIDSIIK